jgi:hypothetical protein
MSDTFELSFLAGRSPWISKVDRFQEGAFSENVDVLLMTIKAAPIQSASARGRQRHT